MVLLAFETGATGLLRFKPLVSQAQINRQKHKIQLRDINIFNK